jgi:hypothetical protein
MNLGYSGPLSASMVLCLALVHFLWQGAVVVGLAALAGALLRRWSSSAHYAALATGMLLLPLTLAGTMTWLAWNAPPLAQLPSAAKTPAETLRAPPLSADWGSIGADEILRLAPAAEVPMTAAAPATFATRLPVAARLLMGAYLAVVGLLGARLLMCLRGANRL